MPPTITLKNRQRNFIAQQLNPSTILLHPCFPAAIENKNVFELGFVAQSFGYVTRCITTFGAAIYDDLLIGGPVGQKLWKQFVPAILVQGERARHVIARKFIIWSRIDPQRSVAPSFRLIDSHQLR